MMSYARGGRFLLFSFLVTSWLPGGRAGYGWALIRLSVGGH